MAEEKRMLCLITAKGELRVEFEGNWSRYEIERAHQRALRELPNHKIALVKALEKEKKKNEPTGESKPTGKSAGKPTGKS